MRRIDIAGKRFGRLTAIEIVDAPSKWLCRCDCGTLTAVFQVNLKRGTTRSCGCLRKEMHRDSHLTHGKARTAEHTCWCRIKARCGNPKHPDWKNYGGRGIAVCQRWRVSFEAFLADMGPRPSALHSIERHDSNGPYSPENCSWEARTVQNNNTRRNHRVTFNGHTLTCAQWDREIGLRQGTVHRRLWRGWSIHEALTPEPRRH